MNFEKWYIEKEWPKIKKEGAGTLVDIAYDSWNACKQEILNILNKNCELEFISHNGKKVYKIYGNVIAKIESDI